MKIFTECNSWLCQRCAVCCQYENSKRTDFRYTDYYKDRGYDIVEREAGDGLFFYVYLYAPCTQLKKSNGMYECKKYTDRTWVCKSHNCMSTEALKEPFAHYTQVRKALAKHNIMYDMYINKDVKKCWARAYVIENPIDRIIYECINMKNKASIAIVNLQDKIYRAREKLASYLADKIKPSVKALKIPEGDPGDPKNTVESTNNKETKKEKE